MTKVLVTGATGQDAYYLMPKLARLGYEVFGLVRGGDPARLKYLQEIPFLRLMQADLLDYSSLIAVATSVVPDIIINTAGVTSPAQCWGTPELAAQVNGVGAIRLMEICNDTRIRYIQFGSIAEFGPYGASKKYAEIMMNDYRTRGFMATTIKFAGHHSPRRSAQFFSRKVSESVARIAAGRQKELSLGPLARLQDWGYAPEFMDAVIEILDTVPGTYTVGTGQPESLENFVKYAFAAVDLDFRDYVKANEYDVQPFDVAKLSVAPDPRLSWQPTTSVEELARIMVTADVAREMELVT